MTQHIIEARVRIEFKTAYEQLYGSNTVSDQRRWMNWENIISPIRNRRNVRYVIEGPVQECLNMIIFLRDMFRDPRIRVYGEDPPLELSDNWIIFCQDRHTLPKRIKDAKPSGYTLILRPQWGMHWTYSQYMY